MFLNIYLSVFQYTFSPHETILMLSGLPVSPQYQQQNYNLAVSDWEANISFLQKTVSSSHLTTSYGGMDRYRPNISKTI